MISAHLVNQKTLFYRASQYIFKNSLKEKIKKTDQFKDFQKMYPAQALEMLTSAMLEELDIQPSQEFQKCKLFPANLFMEDELSDVKIFCDEKIFNCHCVVIWMPVGNNISHKLLLLLVTRLFFNELQNI